MAPINRSQCEQAGGIYLPEVKERVNNLDPNACSNGRVDCSIANDLSQTDSSGDNDGCVTLTDVEKRYGSDPNPETTLNALKNKTKAFLDSAVITPKHASSAYLAPQQIVQKPVDRSAEQSAETQEENEQLAISQEECDAMHGLYLPLLMETGVAECMKKDGNESPLYESKPAYCEAAFMMFREDQISGNKDGCVTFNEYQTITETSGEESERYFEGHKIRFAKVVNWLYNHQARTAGLAAKPALVQVLISESNSVTKTEATRIDMVEELLHVINAGYLERDMLRANGGIKQFWDIASFGRKFLSFSSFIPDGELRKMIEEDDSMTGLWEEWAAGSHLYRERATTKLIEKLRSGMSMGEAIATIGAEISDPEQCFGPTYFKFLNHAFDYAFGEMFFDSAEDIIRNDYPIEIIERLLSIPRGDTKQLGQTLLKMGNWLDTNTLTKRLGRTLLTYYEEFGATTHEETMSEGKYNELAAQYIYEVLSDNPNRVGIKAAGEASKRINAMGGKPGERSPFWNFMFPERPWNFGLLNRAEQQTYAEDILSFGLNIYYGGKAVSAVWGVLSKANSRVIAYLAERHPRLSGYFASMAPTFGKRGLFQSGAIYGKGATGFSGKIALTKSALIKVEAAGSALADAETAVELNAAREALHATNVAIEAVEPALKRELTEVAERFAPKLKEARQAVIHAEGMEAKAAAEASFEALEIQAAREALKVAEGTLKRVNTSLATELDSTLQQLAGDIIKERDAVQTARAAVTNAEATSGNAAAKEALNTAKDGLRAAKATLDAAKRRFNLFADNAFIRKWGYNLDVDNRFIPMVLNTKNALVKAGTVAEQDAAKGALENIKSAVYTYANIEELTTRIGLARRLIAIAAREGKADTMAQSALGAARKELGELLDGVKKRIIDARGAVTPLNVEKTALKAAKATLKTAKKTLKAAKTAPEKAAAKITLGKAQTALKTAKATLKAAKKTLKAAKKTATAADKAKAKMALKPAKAALKAAKAEMKATDAVRGFVTQITEAKRDVIAALTDADRIAAKATLEAARADLKETVKAYIGGSWFRYWILRGAPTGLGHTLNWTWKHTAGMVGRLLKGVEPLAECPPKSFFNRVVYHVHDAIRAVVAGESRGGFSGLAANAVMLFRPVVKAVADNAAKGWTVDVAGSGFLAPRPSWLVALPFRGTGAILRFVSKGVPIKWKYGLPPWWGMIALGKTQATDNPFIRGIPPQTKISPATVRLKKDLGDSELDFAIQEIGSELEARGIEPDGQIIIKEIDLERFDREVWKDKNPATVSDEDYKRASDLYSSMVDNYYGFEPTNAHRHLWEISRRARKRELLSAPSAPKPEGIINPLTGGPGPVSSANILYDLANDPVWSEVGFVYMGEGGTFRSYEGSVEYMGSTPELKKKREVRAYTGSEEFDFNQILAKSVPMLSLFQEDREKNIYEIFADAANTRRPLMEGPKITAVDFMNFYILERDGHGYLIGVPSEMDKSISTLLG